MSAHCMLKRKSELCGSNWITQKQGRQFSHCSRHPRILQTRWPQRASLWKLSGTDSPCIFTHDAKSRQITGRESRDAPFTWPHELLHDHWNKSEGFCRCCSEDAGSYHNTHYARPVSVGTWPTDQPQSPAAHPILVRSRLMRDDCNAFLFIRAY